MTAKPSPRLYVYARLSSDQQLDGHGYQRQLDLARAYADRHGLKIDPLELADLGVSAFDGSNFGPTAALGRFFEMVQTGEIARGSVLALEALDRFSRGDAIRGLARLQDLADAGISVVTLADGKTWDSAALADYGALGAHVELIGARQYSKKIADRVAARKAADRNTAREHGTVITRMLPRWIVGEQGEKPRLHPERVKVVREIFERYARGEGYAVIAKALNARDVPTFTHYGPHSKRKKKRVLSGKWTKTTITRLLSNRAVIGEYQPMTKRKGFHKEAVPAGEPIPDFYPAAVSIELWQTVQAMRSSRAESSGATSGHRGANMLAGISRCPHGHSMRRENKGEGYVRYVCSQTVYAPDACEPGAVQADIVERTLLQNAARFADVPDTGADHTFRLELVRDEIATYERELNRLTDAILAGVDALSVKQRFAETEERKAAAEKVLRDLEALADQSGAARVLARARALRDTLQADPANKAAIAAAMAAVFERVVVDAGRGELVCYWRHAVSPGAELRLAFEAMPA